MIWYEIKIKGIRGLQIIRVDRLTIFYYLLIAAVVLLITVYFIRRSRLGLAMSSIGSSEDAASHVGVNVVMTKVFTFALSAFFIGATAAIFAPRMNYIDPAIAFNPFYSFLPVLMAIFGGMGSLAGPVVGAAAFSYIRELLITRFPFHFELIFGLIMIITILYLPSGLYGLVQKLSRLLRWKRSGGKHAHTSS